MARICPEKGLHLLIEAFHQLAKKWGKDNVRLKVAGYLGDRDKEYYEQIVHQLKNWNIQNSFEYLGCFIHSTMSPAFIFIFSPLLFFFNIRNLYEI